MIEIQEVHDVKYKINLDAEELAPAVYLEMLRVFDCLTKIKTEEDLKDISGYHGIIKMQIVDVPFDDVMRIILDPTRYQKEYVDEVIKCFAGVVIERLIKDNVPVKDPDIYRHCVFDDDKWIYNIKCQIVEYLNKKPFDDIYQKTIEMFKRYNREYVSILKASLMNGVDIRSAIYMTSLCRS